MSKKASRRNRSKRVEEGINWLVVGVVTFGGLLIFAGLIYLAVRPPDNGLVNSTANSLETYCQENKGACVTEGSPDAPVTIVEVSDFGCPHCRDYHVETVPLIEERYITTGDVYYIAVPFALRPQTVPAANGGLCAADQGKFFQYSRAMFNDFESVDHLERSGIIRAAEEAGLEIETFTSCLSQGRYESRIQANVNAAGQAGVSGTPTFFFDGQLVEGAVPFSVFQQEINVLLGAS